MTDDVVELTLLKDCNRSDKNDDIDDNNGVIEDNNDKDFFCQFLHPFLAIFLSRTKLIATMMETYPSRRP